MTLWYYGTYDVGIDSVNLNILSNSNYTPILFALLEKLGLKWSLKK